MGEGGRLLVVAEGPTLLDRLDDCLWTCSDEAFLPHGRASRPGEAEQPVLLAETATEANGARMIALADGRWREEALGYDRVFLLFDASALDGARTTWRALGGAEGVERRYWRQDQDGRWREQG